MTNDEERGTPVPPPPTSDNLRAAVRPASDLPVPRTRRRSVLVAGVDPGLLGWADQARTDLADRLNLPVEAIVVEVVGAVTWSDRSYGCPQPGMAYPQVPVDGVYARLAAAGHTWHYHGDGAIGAFLCEL